MTGKFRIGLKALIIFVLGLILTGCFSRSVLVSFESNGGTPVRDVLVPIGDVLEEPKEPKKEGYEFAGWYQDIDLTTKYEFNEPVEKDMTLYAKWNPAKYTITWETNGGSPLEPTEVSYKATIVAPETPTREGYVFTGWFYEPELETLFNFQTTMPAKDFTLYAGWEKGEYKVTFNTNGGLEVEPVIGTFGEEFDEPVTNRYGYTFQGWYLDPDFENEFTEFIIPSQDITLYAKWEPNDIEVTIVISEGETDTKIVKYNETLEELPTPVRTGFTFKGWVDAESGEAYDFSKPVREPITIKANWETNKYTVTFETNGGSTVEPIVAPYDSLISEPVKPSKIGHDFVGWFKDAEYSEAWDFSKDKVTEDVTLYAKWEVRTYKISFVDSDTPTMEFKYGAQLNAPEDPTKEGYTFAGWYRESTFKTPFDFTGTMPAENITLYARWTVNKYRLIFMVDGELFEDMLMLFGKNIITTPVPEKVGHTFSYWEGLPTTMPARDVTVHAIFTVNTYKITYLVDGLHHQTVNVKFGEAITLLPEPVKTGYTFSGWSESPATMPAEDITVSGNFTVNYYALTVLSSDLDRGSVSVEPVDSPVAYGTEITVTALPEPGYKFSHWTDGSSTESDKATYVFNMPAKNLTLTAVFVPEDNVEYKIIYFGEALDGSGYLILDSITLLGTTEEEVHAEIKVYSGFTFDSENVGNVLTGNILGDGSLELHVYYLRNTYTLTYLVDGEEYFTDNYKFQEEINALAAPVKAGYQFDGWVNLPQYMPAEDIVVSADFSLIEYTINYQLNGGEFAHPQQVKYNITSNFQIANPLREGYTFLGWTFAGQEEPIRDFKITPGRTGDLDLAANWKAIDYIIQYFDGGDLLLLEPNTFTIEDTVLLPIAEKIGHDFLGWYDNSEFVGDPITEIQAGSIGSRNFYAKFELITYTITYHDENWQPLNNPNLITEYTYSETEDVPLVLLPADIGIAFVWEDASGNYYIKISAGTVGDLELKATYIPISNDVSFYNENGVLIGTLYNVPYGTEISLETVFAGKPEYVQKLIELNLTIITCQQSDPFDLYTFQTYFAANYKTIAGISNLMADAASNVLIEQTPESILNLMASADIELGRLVQALNIKISLLQELKDKIQAVIEALGTENEGARSLELYAFVYATKGALTSFSDELADTVNQWLESMGSDVEAFEFMNGLTSLELTNAAVLRQTYRKNHPTKNGYAFIGWQLGADSYYLTHEPGYVFDGKYINAPASGVPGQAAKLIAFYRRLQGLEASFTASTNRLEWTHLSSEILATLYDEETETIDVEYEIYIEDQEGNIYYYTSTIDDRIVLEYLGTYKVKVIPVVRIYENGDLINIVSASISNAVSLEVTVTKKEDQAILESSGNYYHKMTEETGTVFYFFSNTEITFPDAQFTILSGSEYVTVKNNNTLVFGSAYTTEDQNIEFTFTAASGGTEYLGRIYPYISQYELGENLAQYKNITDNIENTLYYNKDVEPYYVGRALIGADENDVLDNDNAFYFDLLIKTSGGKKIELPVSFLDFKAYEIVDGNEVEVAISNNTSGNWEIYRDGKNFYFRESGKTYKIEIDIKDPYVPRKLKEDEIITKKAFVVTINDGINVFTNEELQIAYANTLVKGINIHRNIEAKLNLEQTYVDPDDGIRYPYNYGSTNVVTLYNNGLAYKVGNVYQRISPADAENKDNLVINGNYFTIDGSKLPYTNYEPGNIGIQIPGGSILTQAGALPTIPGYKIRNVLISIFKHISVDTANPAKVNYGGVTYNNLTVIGNTQTPNINYSEGSSDLEEALEIMGRNSGGYVAISNSNNTTLAVDNVVIGSSTIAIWSSNETDVIVNNAHLYNSWANTVYGYGIASLTVSNAILETSGGAAIHVEDSKFSSDYAQTIYFDSATVEVNNWVSGEEPWFKAYSMEFAAMQLKAKINSGVSAINASILRNITDPSSGLLSRKINFVMLILPVAQQLSPTEAIKGEIPIDKHTTPNYSDITVYVLQSGDWYPYDGPYEGKHLVPLSEGLFYQIAQQSGQEYNSVVLPLGEKRSLVLESGISDLGTNIYTNYLAVQADMSTVDRGHAIILLGLDNAQ